MERLRKPLAIELFAGCMGWSRGWLELGGRAIGFDIEHLPHHGPVPENAELVLQDVTTLHGSQFRDGSIIFASPPCQNYSYLAMPWSRSKSDNSQAAKALRRKWETEGPDNRLFDACFRIQREASEAAGRYIPLIVENVRGAQPWVGRSTYNHGSFHLWGDVPALMPITFRSGTKIRGLAHGCFPGGQKVPVYCDPRRNGGKGVHLTSPAENGDGLKRPGIKLSGGFNNWPKDENGAYIMPDGTKIGGRSSARKAASAQIARIPFELSSHIARVYFPRK